MVPSGDLTGLFFGRSVGQIGIIVRDLKTSAQRLSNLWGLGPWRCLTYGPNILAEQWYRGQESEFSVLIALNRSAPQVELLQPLSGPSIYEEWLGEHGEGLHHLAMFVESLDEAIESMGRAGYAPIQIGRGMGADGDGGFAYFDTEADFRVVLEAVEPPKRRRDPEFELE